MKYIVCIIQSQKDNKYYIGQTINAEKRLSEHNRGKVRSTKYRMPFELVYQEECISRIEAIKREKYFKSYKNTKDLLFHLTAKQSSANSKNIV
jgi:putative endonuclease